MINQKIKYKRSNKKINFNVDPELSQYCISYKDDNDDFIFVSNIKIDGSVEMRENIFDSVFENLFINKQKLYFESE
jgi:hypothetical protein